MLSGSDLAETAAFELRLVDSLTGGMGFSERDESETLGLVPVVVMWLARVWSGNVRFA